MRVHAPLFMSDDPMQTEGEFRNDIRPDSEIIYRGAMISSGFGEVRKTAPWPKVAANNEGSAPESVRFQAMRTGYFVGVQSSFIVKTCVPLEASYILFRVSNNACYAQTVDPDTTDDHVVLNRIVSLKEDSGKN